MIPENPQFSDEVLLQDIYAQVDLDQFALDPDEPIEYNTKKYSRMEYPLVHEHPFLSIFPSV